MQSQRTSLWKAGSFFAGIVWITVSLVTLVAANGGKSYSPPEIVENGEHDIRPFTPTIAVDPGPHHLWRPYTIPYTDPEPIQNRPNNMPLFQRDSTEGMTDYVSLDTLIVIYPHTAAGQLTAEDVEIAKAQVNRAAEYIWRNSHFKVHLELTFVVFDDYLDASEFEGYRSDCGWLMPDDRDGDGQSVEKDLLDLGYTENQFDSINLLWAHNNGTITPCSGGLAWPSWYWDSLGRTGFTTNALFFSGESLWNPFHHEIQHTLDFMLGYGGEYDYFHADLPEYANGRFGPGWDFHAVQMRAWPVEKWFAILNVWGDYRETADLDEDGVPDDDDALFVTEATIGSSPTLADTDGDLASDLVEAMAGRFSPSDPNVADTDNDGLIDGVDNYLLYPVPLKVENKTMPMDGRTVRWNLLTDTITQANVPFEAETYANWDNDNLYLMFTTDRFAQIEVYLDLNGDGFWNGKDNYHITLRTRGSSTASDVVHKVRVFDSTDEILSTVGYPMWDDDPDYPNGRLLTESDIARYSKGNDINGYLVQIAIPRNADTAFVPTFGQEVGFTFWYNFIEYVWEQQAWTFEENQLVFVPLISAAGVPIEGLINGSGLCDQSLYAVDQASIQAVGQNDAVNEVLTANNGFYRLWLKERFSPYEVTLSAANHLSETVSVELIHGEIARVDATLRYNQACLTVQPDQVDAQLEPGETATIPLAIQNDGAADGDVNFLVLPEAFPVNGRIDNFGYTYADSNDSFGPQYSWIELAPEEGGSGTAVEPLLNADDVYTWPIDLPFSFPFYDGEYDQIGISSNGIILFEETDEGFWYGNAPLPTAQTFLGTDRLIAPFWDDLYHFNDTAVYTHEVGDAFIIEFYNVYGYYQTPDAGTWQVVLYSNGNILLQFKDTYFGTAVYDFGGNATVGIQGDGNTGITYSYNTPSLHDELAICFAYPGMMQNCSGDSSVSWASLPLEATVPADDATAVSLHLDATLTESVALGHNRAKLVVLTDALAEFVIPLEMEVKEEETEEPEEPEEPVENELIYLPLIKND